ncbi:MAG: efflux RND transporter permease subunit [Planctomycetes bacterium]|nr:efflux RND transporter permease subunit [Planctomycetota bacterium]
MFSRFFIDRPIFASVLSIIITLTGGVALFSLPIAQYPPIVPPTIQVMCNYPGASAQVVAESVAAPIEQCVNGVEEMLYMSSNSTNDGSYTLQVTFKPGVDLNFAQVLVQNKVNLALPLLPDVVKQTGVTTRKRSPDILLIISLVSPTNRYDQLYLSNYGTMRIKDELARVDGVGDVIAFGARDYSMRIWVDPQKLAELHLNASDVATAIRQQNAQVACGQIGQPPTDGDQQLQVTVTTQGRLVEPAQFENIVIKRTKEGRIVRLKDVGRATLGAKNMDVENRLDGTPCANIAVFQLPYANAIETADRVRAKMKELAQSLPPGMEYKIRFDTTPFIRESIAEVVRTLFLAVILVAIVVLMFLQSWRSAIIPLVAVPVAIVGTFAVMAAIGFSLNNLTLFGLVLAIGIVVDDAIVVVEAVEHHIEEGMAPRDATIQAMKEVSGPVIAVALVLTAVFMPCAFISGLTGSFFRQFAVTVSVSTVISAFNSLTLSPALAAILLKPHKERTDIGTRVMDFSLGWFFRLFNWAFRKSTKGYVWIVGRMIRGSAVVLVLYGGLLVLTWWSFGQLPTGYIPAQDKGYFAISLQLPDAAGVERTAAVVKRIEKILQEDPAIKAVETSAESLAGDSHEPSDKAGHVITLAGQSFTLQLYSPNTGQFFVILKDFDERRDKSLYYTAVMDRVKKRIAAEVTDAQVFIFGPPPLQGLGNTGGFRFLLEDRSDQGLAALQAQAQEFQKLAMSPPTSAYVTNVQTVFTVRYPQLLADINRDQCHNMQLNLGDVYSTMQSYLGSLYVNDFNLNGRTWQVVMQADSRFRNEVQDIPKLKIRNQSGGMVPLGAVANIPLKTGPLVVPRYNLYPSASFTGAWPASGSSGEAIDAINKLARDKGLIIEWTEISYLQLLAENTGMVIFGLAVLLVFLVLAAQYESWSLPLAIILVVPMCLLSAVTGVWIAGSDINVFTQIGFVVLVGLASKNAVLIVEFAKHKHQEAGLSITKAALVACRLRLRPILMTSFAFILGVVPLMISTGAGMEMRRSLGTAVFSGMLGVTFFGIFLTPVFFYVIEWLAESSFFQSPGMRHVNAIFLNIFELGGLRKVVRDAMIAEEDKPD